MKLAFTVCSVSHLGQAKTMADSFVKHNPDYQLKIGVVDRITGRINASQFADYELIEIEEVGIPNLEELIQKYDVFEMCGLIRPYLAELLFNRHADLQKLMYIDTDILIFDSFDRVVSELDTHDIILTPHAFQPFPEDGLYPKEVSFNNAGLYNSGFFAVKRSVSGNDFLKWWQQRLSEYGSVNFMDGMFVDQLWLNFVPLFFDKVLVSKDLGLNVGYWNLHERQLTNVNEKFIVNEKYPLIFFHYSGYKLDVPDKISVHTDRFDLTTRPELRPVFEAYHQGLLENSFDTFRQLGNALIAQKSYMRWGILREYALRISRKIIRELHG
jgi:hypothetical protein